MRGYEKESKGRKWNADNEAALMSLRTLLERSRWVSVVFVDGTPPPGEIPFTKPTKVSPEMLQLESESALCG